MRSDFLSDIVLFLNNSLALHIGTKSLGNGYGAVLVNELVAKYLCTVDNNCFDRVGNLHCSCSPLCVFSVEAAVSPFAVTVTEKVISVTL